METKKYKRLPYGNSNFESIIARKQKSLHIFWGIATKKLIIGLEIKFG
jgi:hypothetical protein